MNSRQLPSVELIQDNSVPEMPARGPAGWRRWKVFFSVFLLLALIGLAIVYARSPVYRASASVLTVKPKAVDSRSAEADLEHVAIQRRLLLGEDLLSRLTQRLDQGGEYFSTDELRSVLSVEPVPETNLLELRAEGELPEQLQGLVNAWAESYEAFRADEIEAATGRTTAELNDEQIQILARIDDARLELQNFREAHDIVSLERSENRSLSKLKGLNNSLNKARERLIELEAAKTAVIEALARGETVIPDAQKSDITKMRLAVQRARVRLAELKQKYTQRYIDRDPNLKQLPDDLRNRQVELSQALEIAKQTSRDESVQAVDAARIAVASLERELDEHQTRVQQFTLRFKEFKALEEGLARLEKLHADNAERLAQIHVKNLKKYPPIKVVEWARLPAKPIHPDYERDAMLVVGGALVMALFATWLVEYLSEKPSRHQNQPNLGIRIYTGDASPTLESHATHERLIADHAVEVPHLAQPSAPEAAAQPLPVLPRELAAAEIHSLYGFLSPQLSAYSGLMLSGISPYEIPLLHADCFDASEKHIRVPGAGAREFRVSDKAWTSFSGILPVMRGQQPPMPISDIDQGLRQAAQQAQLTDATGISALSIWHSYVLYLVRQGIDTASLDQRIGTLPPAIAAALMHFAPPGGSRPDSRIDFTYPVLGA